MGSRSESVSERSEEAMSQALTDIIICIRCGQRWTVDLAKLGKPEKILYRGDNQKLRVEVFRLLCPRCGTVNMHEVTFEERRDA
jgi:hypothetical protein